MARPASLKDIAQEIGISYSLVSKVLNGKMGTSGVSPEMKKSIFDTAERLNYRPHPLATALKDGRKGAVGVMIHPVGEPGSDIITNFLRGASDGLDERGLRMWLRFFEFDEELIRHIDRRLRSDVDGLIVAGVPHPATYAMIKNLHLSGLPIVSMLERDNIPGVTNVSPDRQMQGEIAARHLLDAGCKRIAHILVPGQQLRYEGSLAAHAERGLSPDPRLVYSTDLYTTETGEAAARHWIERGLQFDGVLTQSDYQAAGVINELHRRGRRVPDDVRVVGVDDSPFATAFNVPITSVTAEMKAVGRLAADLLARKLDGETVESVKLPPRIAVRSSA